MFDIKLIDGRYFKNVEIFDEFGQIVNIGNILDGEYPMFVYHKNDDEGANQLAEIKSEDIEYVCKEYEYKENKS